MIERRPRMWRFSLMYAIGALLTSAWPGPASAIQRGVSVAITLGDQPPVLASPVFDPQDQEHPVTLDITDGFGNHGRADAKVVDAVVPQVSGAAQVRAASSGAGKSFAEAVIDVHLSYGITLVGPNPLVSPAPIVFRGVTSIIANAFDLVASTSLTYAGGVLTAVDAGLGQPLLGILGVGWTAPDCAGACTLVDPFTYSSLISLNDGLPVDVAVTGHLDIKATTPDEFASGTLMIDPYIYLDPLWSLAHPEYHLVIEAGIGNTAPVPVPGTGLLLAPALLALYMRREDAAR